MKNKSPYTFMERFTGRNVTYVAVMAVMFAGSCVLFGGFIWLLVWLWKHWLISLLF